MNELPGGRLAARRAAELLIRHHGDALLATARRYTGSIEDAEDAYQRGLEILLRKAPAVTEAELLPWTKTVIKHEAYAIWRSRDRSALAPDEEPLEHAASAAPSPDEQLESLERIRVSAEAIGRLKPQEVRCLVLRAEGYSYRQICRITGFTYTKVNRCLTEGRRSFLKRVAGIESGAECERLAPLLSALADGEASAGDMAALRPHLRSCLACRAALRVYREVPHRAAEAVPVAGGAAMEEAPAALWRWADSALAWAQDRVALIAAKVQAATEGASAGKVAAVAASTAALAGGAVAVRSLEGRTADAGAQVDTPAARTLDRPAPIDLTRLEEPEPEPTEQVAAPELAAVPPVATPEAVATHVGAAPPPPPEPPPVAATEPAVAPAPESFPSSATVAVDGRSKDSVLTGEGEEEREIDPMTTPVERPMRMTPLTGPAAEEP